MFVASNDLAVGRQMVPVSSIGRSLMFYWRSNIWQLQGCTNFFSFESGSSG